MAKTPTRKRDLQKMIGFYDDPETFDRLLKAAQRKKNPKLQNVSGYVRDMAHRHLRRIENQ